jgi:carboxyl-terminal processing protease
MSWPTLVLLGALAVVSPWSAAAVAAAALCAAPAPAPAAAPPRPAEERRLDLDSFDHVWTRIRDIHWDPTFGGLDWDAVRGELRPKAERAASREEVRAVLDDMISRFGKSHYAIIPAEVYEVFNSPKGEGERDGAAGMDVRVVEGRLLVTSVEEGSPAAQNGVRPGWEIVRLRDVDLKARVRKALRKLEGNRNREALIAAGAEDLLLGKVGEPLPVVFRDGRDRRVALTLPLALVKGEKYGIGVFPSFPVWMDVSRGDDGIGVIRWNMFMDPPRLMPIFNDAMQSFLEARGVVLDVRGNPGGIGEMVMGMAGWFLPDKPSLGTLTTREFELRVLAYSRPSTFGGPVAVLVDELSGSASELLSGGLQDLGRARVFGGRTMGAALPSTIEWLPNGDGFQYAHANYVSASGRSLEGEGVTPDEPAPLTREALLGGRDPALDAALAWIRSQSQPQSSDSTEVKQP